MQKEHFRDISLFKYWFYSIFFPFFTFCAKFTFFVVLRSYLLINTSFLLQIFTEVGKHYFGYPKPIICIEDYKDPKIQAHEEEKFWPKFWLNIWNG